MTVRTPVLPGPRAPGHDRPDPGRTIAHALELADRDPATATRLALDVLGDRTTPVAARVDARIVLGRAAWIRRDATSAVTHLRGAVRSAQRAGLVERAAQARLTLAAALAERGHSSAALRALAAAEPHLRGVDLARLAGQRAYLHYLEGRLVEALAGHEAAYAQFRRLGDGVRQAVALNNMAVIHTRTGALARAAEELRRAHDLFAAAGELLHAAEAAANLGWVLARQGRVPEALRWFHTADVLGASEPDPQATKDRADALLDARLLPEAREAALAAAADFERRGMPGQVAECRLLAARSALLAGDLVCARAEADAAVRAAGARRPAVRALARHLAALTTLHEGPSPEAASRARSVALRTVGVLEREGWRLQALDARVTAAQLALAAGRPGAARADLAHVAHWPAGRSAGPVQLRIAVAHARALLHVVEGDPAAARRALRAGVRELERQRLSLGATELQTLATGHALQLLGVGLDLALEARDPWEVLAWSERGRAASLRARPPTDPAIVEALDALRQSAAATERALLDGSDPRAALARQVALERDVRRRSLTVDAPGAAAAGVRLDRPAIRRTLGEAALLQLVEHRGRAYGVLVTGASTRGRAARLQELGTVGQIATELDALRFAAARLARGTGSARARDAAATAYAAAAGRIDRALLGPFAASLADRPLVITPSGPWHALPWAALPSCADRVVTVAPSTALWLRTSMTARRGEGAVVVAAGPGLADAEREAAAVAGVHAAARRLDGSNATVAAVLAAMDGARLAHVAAHGTFRADQPQLSALRLADGPLTVYDLETLATPPHTLVLTACDVGLSRVHSGEEVQGFAAALLTLGARHVVASVAPVADDLAAAFAVDLHRELADDRRPAEALAAVQHDWRGRAPRAAATANSFVCFGAG